MGYSYIIFRFVSLRNWSLSANIRPRSIQTFLFGFCLEAEWGLGTWGKSGYDILWRHYTENTEKTNS